MVHIGKPISREWAKWLNKGFSPSELKALMEKIPLEFEKRDMKLAPPHLDDWMFHRLRTSVNSKATKTSEKTWLSVQLKVMNIDSPLLHLYSLIKSADIRMKTRPLTAVAANEISRRRRGSVLAQTDPRSTFLVGDPKSFSIRETIHQFGQRFVDTLLKEADQDEKLSRQSRPGLSSVEAGPASRIRTKRDASNGQRGRGSRGRRCEFSLSHTRSNLPSTNDCIGDRRHVDDRPL